jgi:hypothetical protein
MKKIIPTLIILFSMSATGLAQNPQNYRCTMGDLTRRVEIVSEPGIVVPCEVHYFRDDEAPGEQQVLWRALNEAGYCESKAREFVARLGEAGWSCDGTDVPLLERADEPADDSADEPTAEPVDETVDADDTADLAPAAEPVPENPR